MKTYNVVVKMVNETEPGTFAGINLGEDGYFEIEDADFENQTETYNVYTERDIDQQLDLSESVLIYIVECEECNQLGSHEYDCPNRGW